MEGTTETRDSCEGISGEKGERASFTQGVMKASRLIFQENRMSGSCCLNSFASLNGKKGTAKTKDTYFQKGRKESFSTLGERRGFTEIEDECPNSGDSVSGFPEESRMSKTRTWIALTDIRRFLVSVFQEEQTQLPHPSPRLALLRSTRDTVR